MFAGGALFAMRRRANDASVGRATDGSAAAPAGTAVAPTAAASRPVGRVVPEGLRVRVEVLNATDTRGLARQAMFALRDAGFDVVAFGTTAERQDSSLVLDRRGHADWAQLAVKTLGEARAELRPDSSRFLDLTILIGKRWTPPSEPLHP